MKLDAKGKIDFITSFNYFRFLTVERQPSLAIPPFGYYVGQETVNGIETQKWEAKETDETILTYFVANQTKNDKFLPQLVRVIVSKPSRSFTLDVEDIVEGPQDPKLFDPEPFGCPLPDPSKLISFF